MSSVATTSLGLTTVVTPKSVAIVGASDNPARIGGRILARLLETYKGTLFPVNPRRATVQGHESFPSLSRIDNPPDLVIVSTPAESVIEVAHEAAQRGAGALLVLSAGFGETGDDGRALQDELVGISSAAGMRVVGPNSLGVLNLRNGLRAVFTTMTDVPQEPGNVAIVSQSGGYGMSLFEQAQTTGLAVSYVCPTGNEADVACADYVDYFVDQPDVDVIALALEGVRKPELLLQAGRRATEAGKVIVALRAGGSRAGARAAASHTGAIATADDALSAAFESSGIVRVNSSAELLSTVRVAADGRRPGGRRLAVATGSGGAGVLIADAATSDGLEMPEPEGELRDELSSLVPEFGSIANPIDATAQLINDQVKFRQLLTTLGNTDSYDMVLVSGAARGLGQTFRDQIIAAHNATTKPFVVWAAQPDVALALNQAGVTACTDLDLTVRAMSHMADYQENRSLLRNAPDRRVKAIGNQQRTALSEQRSRDYVVKAGISVPQERTVSTRSEAVEAANKMGCAVALKLNSEHLTHKSEHGAVRLGVRPGDVGSTYDELTSLAGKLLPGESSWSVIVQEMVPAGIELFCSALCDPTVGPVVAIGLGGTLVEIVADRQLAMAPLSHDEAERLIRRITSGRVWDSARGIATERIPEIADVVCRIGNLIVDHPELAEIEINPLIVTPTGVLAVDALASVDGTL